MSEPPPVDALKRFFDAIGKGERETIDTLLREHPALANTPGDDEGGRALHAAASRADVETVALLLSRGADPAVQDAYGNTPLHSAVSARASMSADAAAVAACVDLLADRTPDLAVVNHNGHTPLRHALWSANGPARARLRERGAPLDGTRPVWTPPAEVAASVATVLSRAWNGPVSLGNAYRLRGDRVLRLDIADAPGDAPASVVVKRAYQEPERPYDPDSTDPRNPSSEFLREWANTRLLSEMPGAGEYAVRLYGGDREVGLFVIEDLGDGDALVDALLGDDPRRADEELRMLAVSLGRMHAETAGREARCQEIREALGYRRSQGWWLDPREHRDALHKGFEVVGVTPAAGFDEELEQVARTVGTPGPFLAFVHGDPCPDNCRIVEGRVRLFDFTGPGYRHAFSDALYGRVPFPTCWCVNRLPAHVAPMMEAAYRAELVRGCPEAADDTRFYRELVHCMAAWLIFGRNWRLENARGDDDWQWGISTWRQRVLVRLDALAQTTDELGHLPAMGETARRCTGALRAIWPPDADAMPLYPAFREAAGAVG